MGPSLSGMVLGLDALAASLGTDAQTAEEITFRLRREADRAVEEVRRIIDALHPSALDGQGLVPALRERAAAVLRLGLVVVVEAPEVMPPLTEQVEVAALRIAEEAVTNVVRHAGATHCVVRLAVDDELTVTVCDDGRGLPPELTGDGVGLSSMRHRAEELGGSFEMPAGPPGRRGRRASPSAGGVVAAAVRVVIADDHPMFRFGVAAALATVPEVELVGEAADGRELLAVVAATSPDVVLTDLAMPGLDGAAATQAMLARTPGLGVLVLTMHADDESVFRALRAGARGYLLKGAGRDELVRAVLAVAAGDAMYDAPVARRILDFVTGAKERPVAFPDLTPREREVLDLLAGGARNSAIARALGMTDKTVRNHVSAILGKLQVPDRTAAALRGREGGLGGPPA